MKQENKDAIRNFSILFVITILAVWLEFKALKFIFTILITLLLGFLSLGAKKSG